MFRDPTGVLVFVLEVQTSGTAEHVTPEEPVVMVIQCSFFSQVNESVLRPASVEPLSDLQLAEELIKQEMITMLHFDCLHHPSAASASLLQRSKSRGPASTSNNASHIAYLESNSYQPISTEEMEQVTTHSLRMVLTAALNQAFSVSLDLARDRSL